jgi:hypothetical protein
MCLAGLLVDMLSMAVLPVLVATLQNRELERQAAGEAADLTTPLYATQVLVVSVGGLISRRHHFLQVSASA